MLAFIGGLFAGIFGIFPFGKKSEYLLEFDKTKKTSTPKQESTQPKVATPAPAPTKTEAKPASSETPKEAKAKLSAAKKAEKVEAQQPTAPQVAAPQPPITNGTAPQKPEEVVLFAPNFLMPKPTAKRRRPGPNMGIFRGMAKSMNLPR